MAAVIELKNVTFTAQNQVIVRNFSHCFEEGKTTALVGPSGSGKSTVLKLAAGVLVPLSGDVMFRGKDVFSMSRVENLAFRREASMVFQDSALWANQNLFQCLELPLRIHYPKMTLRERETRIQSVLHEVGYRRDLSIRPSLLSMGEQKIIAYARAMMCWPRLLFLDEWTESLDDAAAFRLVNLVKRHRGEGHTVVFISHDFRLIRELADYVVMILDGQSYLNFTRQQMDEDEDLAHYIERGIAS